jgi:hypothetical protein
MRLSRLCCILAALVLLTSAGTALHLDIKGEKQWLVAGGDSAGLSLEISGGTGSFTITATVPPDGLCTVTPPTLTTTSNNPPPMQVTSKEMSGVCQIDMRVTDTNGNTETQQFLQKIDHTTPIYVDRVPLQGATVGTVVPVWVRIQDLFHNNVDNRNIAESVTFTTNGGSGFVNGAYVNTDPKVETITAQVDEGGVASVQYYVGKFESPNYITYAPPAPLGPGIIAIEGLLNGVPASITSQISPNAATPPWVYADGKSIFTITYAVFDTNGFPVEAAKIKGMTSEGATFEGVTNRLGQVDKQYGPFSKEGRHTITAWLVNDPSVRLTDIMDAISMHPEHLVATGNPISMPSRDVSSTSTSIVSGRVSDPKGNPVKGEKVTFQITDLVASKALKEEPYLTTDPSSKSKKDQYPKGKAVTIATDNDGNAILYFIPGEFQSKKKDPDFDPLAEGTVTVTATWGSKTETITLTFKRTAYLSLKTKVADTTDGDLTVEKGGTFDVTIEVTGDGSMMTSYPVEVMLVTDRSGSMDLKVSEKKTDGSYMSRFDSVKEASHAFLDGLNPGKDKVGLVSYHTWATHDADLTSDFTSLGNTIDQLTIPRANDWVPNKGPVRLTNMRDGIFNATTYLKIYGSKSPKVAKAVVVLTDGVWNWGGTPLAQGRGYAQRTRTVVWTDTYFGNDCGSGSACLQKYRTDSFYWPGATSFSMYTYYNPELYTDLQGNPVMTDPGPLAFTGQGLGTAHRFDGPDGSNGYLCHPIVPLNKDPGGPAWPYYMCPKNSGICNSNIGCYGGDKYRVDVCDATYTGTDCSSSEQNMAVFAKNNNIRIYTITYAENYNENTGDEAHKATADALTILSESTGGFYRHAATKEELEKVYEAIANDLITSAGVETTMLADNEMVTEIWEDKEWEGGEVFEYMPLKDISTVTRKWDKAGDLIEGTPTWKSQWDEWNRDKQISFLIGSIEIGQKWQMIYRMKAKKVGTYNVFGANSLLTWTDWNGESKSLEFPETPITVLDPGTPPSDARLTLSDLHTETVADGPTSVIDENEPFTLAWKLLFTDTSPNGKANLKVRVYGREGTVYDHELNYPDEKGPKNEDIDLTFPWSGLPEGKYTAKVKAWGSGNSAYPAYYDFEVGNTPDKAKIIIR